MCDHPACTNEAVCYVDVDPNGATVQRPLIGDSGPVLDDDGQPTYYALNIGSQRLSYCVAHSAEAGLNAVISHGHMDTLASVPTAYPLPADHALALTWGWVLDG